MIQPDESIHVTIKKPPLTIRSIGIFDSDELIPDIVKRFLENTKPSTEFVANTNEEVQLLLSQSKILTVAVSSDVYTITVRKIK